MYKQPDAEGRYPLSYREYAGLRAIMAANNNLLLNYKELESRIRLIPNGWRDIKCLLSLSEKLLQALLRTVPTPKLQAMKKELSKTYCELRVEGPLKGEVSECTYVPEAALERVVEHAIKFTCFCCEKCGKEYKRCQLFQDVQSMYHYDFPFMKDGLCPLSDLAELPEKKEEGCVSHES